MLCRFCDHHSVRQPEEPEGPSYMTTLSSEKPNIDTLLEKVVMLEKRGVLPCVTTWCNRCQRVTVIPCASVFTTQQAQQYYLSLVSWTRSMYICDPLPMYSQDRDLESPPLDPECTELYKPYLPLSMVSQRQRSLYPMK